MFKNFRTLTKAKLTLVAVLLLVGLVTAQAQAVDLFSDGFESGDFATGGWTTQNSDAAVKERAANTGTYGAEAAKVTWIEKAISTAGYETIHLKYYRQTKGFDSGENLYVEWFDGSSWNPLETLQSGKYSDGLQDKVCGAGADDNASFKIRFRTNANKVNEYAFIDDVVVSGTSTVVDTDPPTPDPATFASPPAAISETEITMTATTGSDASPPVQYYFAETSGNPGGADRGWSTDPAYTNSGLQANTQYTYTVQMRDSIPNIGTASAPASATTPDNTPPSPDPMTWVTLPYSTGTTSIAMVASTASDISGVEYYFQCTSGGGNDSGWQDSTSYEDTGLSPDTQYCYAVQARDKSPNQNATGFSTPAACATTEALPDTTPPTPDPMDWATAPYSTGTTSIAMVASTASDASGVEYYFQCTSGGGNDSGWQDSTSYEDTGLSPDTQYCYAVQARDKSPAQNATGFSTPAACATTDAVPDTTPPTPDPMDWATPPYSTGTTSIAMVASTATDVSGVEYYFQCTSGGGNDSGWQDSTSYTDTGLSAATQYCYAVQARDKSPAQNATAASSPPACATTDAVPDTTPPSPDPMTWATPPYSTGTTSIAMVGTTATDASGVEYYFQCTSGGGNDSGWQDSTSYEDAGLSPDTQYCYVVQARDKSVNQNATAWSSPAACATTDSPPLPGGLTVIGTATYGGTDYNLVWDDDNGGGENVVYLDYDYSDGTFVNHPDAIAWAQGLDAALTINLLPGYSVTWSGSWRLPYMSPNELYDLDEVEPDASTVFNNWALTPRYWVNNSATGHIYDLNANSILQHDNPYDYDNGAIAVRSAIEVIPSAAPTIEFELAASGDLESVTPALIDVIVDYADANETYTVDYAVTGGTATGGGVDYTLANGTLTFVPGDTNETISIDVVDDGAPEDDETIIITLSNPIGLDAQLGSITEHTYTILDPSVRIGFDVASGSGMEDVTPVYVSVSLSAPATETITVDYNVIGGTATGGGGDYTLDPGTLTFNIDDVTKDIVIDIISDANQEPAETIIIELSNPTSAKLGTQTQYTYTIVSEMVHLKVDFALVYCPDTSTIRPESAKPGWWPWAVEGWADMYMHDMRWEDGSISPKPTGPGINGTGIHACITTGSEGQLGLHMKDLCRDNLGGGGCPTGNPAGDPIANTWLYAVDWAGPEAGDILLLLTDLPPGEYWLYSYHNHWEPCSQGTRNCMQCECGMPPMPSITANPLPSSPPPGYNGYSLPLGSGTGVTQIENAYNVWPTHYYLDSELVPSLIKFETDGSEVLVIYEADNTLWPDCARPGREGSRGILNAFELILMGPGGPDVNPPSPDPMTWATPPYSTGTTSIAMVATTAADVSGVEYYFQCTSGGGNNSGWQDSTSYEDTGLSPDTQYCYAVQARDKSPNQNATGFSTPAACATTDTIPDTMPPSPDPMTWATPPFSTGTSSIAMVATTATDDSGVEYYFQCTSGGGNDSGWQDSTSYEDTGLSGGTQYCYAVMARDKSPNQNATAWSSTECATTDVPPPDTTPPTPDPMTWATQPYATGPYSISMTATTATDVSGVEYLFECTAGGGNNSGWQDSTGYTDTGLSPITQYTYKVQARDKSANQNATAFSGEASATTNAESAAKLRGAFHFRADSDPSARVGPHPDIMVRLGVGDDKLIFRRDQGYLPVWYTTSIGEQVLTVRVARSNCETTVNPFSRVRLVENNSARSIVHWRYTPNCDSAGMTGWVDEYFTVYPDGLCMRTVKNAAGTTFAQWDTGTPDIYALQLLDTGLDVVPASWLDAPALSVTSGSYTDDGYNSERRCYELQCNTTCDPTALDVTLDTTGGKLVHNPVLVLKNWGDADADVSVDSQPFSNCYIGYADEMYGDDLVVWLNIESSASIDVSITPSGGSGQFINRAAPPDFGYDFDIDVPPMPMGSADPGPFGAYYTNLLYNNRYDEQWRVGDHPDVVVQFDDAAHRLVFWRGTNYTPSWTTDTAETLYSNWYCNQFIERRASEWGGAGCCGEPMQDYNNRYSHVRIISSNPARAIVQWRYASCDYNYDIVRDGAGDIWGDWDEEYFTIYPDGIAVREQTAYSQRTGGGDMESPHIEYHEIIPLTNPGTIPEDCIHWNALSATDYSGSSYDWVAQDVDGGAMTNLGAIANRPIYVVRMKGSTVPVGIVEGTWVEHDPVEQDNCRPFNHYDDWPAWPEADRSMGGPLWDEDPATHCYRYFWTLYPAHCSVLHMKWDDYEHVTDVRRTKIMLNGMVDATEAANVNNMLPLARSWQYAPSVSITGAGFTGGSYDKTERAYKFTRTDPQATSLEFTLQGSSSSPIVNPCFVIDDWDNDNASLSIDGQPVTPGSDFRQGIEMTSDEVPSLVVWFTQDTTSPIDVVIGEAADANDFTPPVPDPMGWVTVPYATSSTSISMTAETATDPSGVQYYFECTAGGGNSSGWQNSETYEDTGLSPATQYTYRVQARDKSPNQNATAFSLEESATTLPPDLTPPTPDPMTWATPPYSTGTTSIAMVATTATDTSGVEYYFQCTSGGGNDSGWQDSTSYSDTGLSAATQYCYAVQARDKSPNQNATAWSSPAACATTDSLPSLQLLVDVGGCGPLQSGWISLGACGTYVDVDGTGIDVTLATGNPSACACRNPGGTGTLPDVEADLLFADNEMSSPGADFILTLSNLAPGASYQLLSYHSRSDEGDTTIPNVTVTGATDVTKPSSILQSSAIMDNPAEILFTAGAGDVVIRYQAPSGGCGGCQVFFNGFELYSTAPANPAVGFETSSSGGLETVTPALISVVVTNADPAETYTVDYAATGGTATGGGVDYTLVPDTLTFNPGVTQQNVSIDIVDDGGGEPDETIIVTLSNVTGLDAVLGTSQHTYTISDGMPTVAFDSGSSSGDESVTPADIAVSLSVATDQSVTVDYAVTGGTATGGGVDYTLLGSGTVTFDPFVTTQNVSLDIVDDGDIESAETVQLTLSNPTNATLGSTTLHTYTINDNDLLEGLMWDGLTWFYSGSPTDLFINVDDDLEWSPQGGEQYITRIPDQALSQVGQVVQRSYYWLTDGQHNCADCFDCPGGCYDDSIECIAGTSDMRVGLFEADGEWVTSDGFSVTGSSIFAGYKGYAWRFGPNMLAGPTRWVDCTSEVHKTGNFQKKTASLDNLMFTNDGLQAYIPGFELTVGEWSVLTVKLERTSSSSVASSITLNDRSYTWTDSSSSDQPSKIDVLAVHMRNNRPYSRLVLGSTTGPDNDPPSPDPMTWATMPYGSSSTAVTMVATTATDVSGVEYYFECTAGAGSDSGWQDSTIYVDSGLQPETSYTYRVMARDKSANQNPTGWSTEETGTTLASEPSKIAPGSITTTCSSVNYQLEGYYTANENGLTGDLHTNLIGSNPAVPPPPGDGTMWLSNGIAGQWIQYEFDQVYTLTTMWVWNYNQDVTGGGDLRTNRGFNQCTIEYSTNGIDWTQLGGTQTFAEADGSPTYAHNTEIAFGSVDAKFVRLTCISNHAGSHAGLSEVRFYHAGP
ncbi:MAG: Calx-beta domain-containing protein [Planctomycetota bacterium]|jgi:hypothetical protein